jgi:hypothetical protein
VIESPTPAGERDRLEREAQEIATVYAPFAEAQAVDRITIAVCRTNACVELREASTERFDFARAANGTWASAGTGTP